MKKLISIVSAIAMMASMAFTVHAEAPTISLKYDADNSTDEKLVIDVYYTGTIDAADLLFYLVDEDGEQAGTNYIADDENAVSIYQNNSGLASANLAGMYNSELGLIAVNFMDTFTQPADKPAIKIGIELKKAIDIELSYELDYDNYVSADGEDYYEEVVLGEVLPIPGANVGPTLETVPATEFTYDENAQLKGEEFVKDDSEDVDVYVAEYTFKSGQTKFFWSATIDSKTKKTADKAIPNVDGQAKLGIIIPASVGATAVALNVQ